MLGDDFRQAVYPLFESGAIDVLEWSFDVAWAPPGLPAWADALLAAYASAGRLIGHGVSLSLLSGDWHARQEEWMTLLAREVAARAYSHVSEHFGFMTAGAFDRSAPLPVPMTAGALALGRERLQRLADVAGVPVGLENLAFAFGRHDVARQGEFLDRLLDPVNGYLVLDLHNLYCQVINFDEHPDRLLASYPLHRVREIHVSGGSFSVSAFTARPIRRDTHDGPLPDDLLALVELAVPRCPHVEAIIVERIDGTLPDADAAAAFRADYRRLAALLEAMHA